MSTTRHLQTIRTAERRRAPRARLALAALLLLSTLASRAVGQSTPYRGLWAGQATLTYVNEVSVALDENNVARAPDPEVTTPTGDAANLQLILHVNGAGQTFLLKDVAILSRTDDTNMLLRSESDMALVTDETLYGEFPQQAALRIACAAFDFGDSRATAALDAVAAAASAAAAQSVMDTDQDVTTTAGRLAAIAAARSAAYAAAQPLVGVANVADAYVAFMRDHLKSTDVDAIAAAADPAAAAQAALDAAVALRDASFYGDTRGVDMVNGIVAAVTSETNAAEKGSAAHAVASAYADVANGYQRFIAGKMVGDMIASAADTAARAATNAAATRAFIQDAVAADPAVYATRAEALRQKVSKYKDSRYDDAIDAVLAAVVDTAVAAAPADPAAVRSVRESAEAAGRAMLNGGVARYGIPPSTPTPDYDTFVVSEGYLESAETAAQAAAEGAVDERRNNALYTSSSVNDAARIAAFDALSSVYADAARAVRNELPMSGTFASGSGDARVTWDIEQAGGGALGSAGLTATISLPASHPTNPFRHRRHPDHTVGLDIERKLRLDFDGMPTNTLERARFGVDRITGVYREEIFGLHKPLGPGKDIGLRTEGRFELNRISLIDALNAK